MRQTKAILFVVLAACLASLACVASADPPITPVVYDDAISREIIVLTGPPIMPVVQDDAVSREIMALAGPPVTPGVSDDAISREIMALTGPPVTPAVHDDAVSREMTALTGPPTTSVVHDDANSREFTVSVEQAPLIMAKKMANDREVWLASAAVSAAFPGYFYLEALNRSSGVRVAWPGSVNVGDKVDIIGTTATNNDFERYVAASTVSLAGTAQIKQLVMKNLLLGGGDFMYDPLTGSGQRGITGASSLNNIGLLVAIAGRVTASGTYPRLGISWFYADDGSGVDDGTGVKGVYAEAPISIAPPEQGAYVLATGVSSCDFYDEKLVNVLLIRTLEDITVFSGTGGLLNRTFAASSEDKTPPRLLIR
jgi:hypothetical protein